MLGDTPRRYPQFILDERHPEHVEKFQGSWWLPDEPEHKVLGTLAIDDDGAAELALFGELRPFGYAAEATTSADGVTTLRVTPQSIRDSGSYPRVVGEAINRSYTLEGCYRIQHTLSLTNGLPLETLHVGEVFDGLEFEEGEALTFDGCVAGIRWLTDWIGRSAMQEEYNWEPSLGPRRLSLSVSELPRLEVRLSDTSFAIEHGFGIKGDRVHERCVSQQWTVRFQTPDLRPVKAILDVVSDFQDLVSLGTGRVAEFRRIELLHPTSIIELPSGETHRKGVRMHAQWTVRDRKTDESLSPHKMVFTFEEFGGEEGVSRWLQIAERHRGALGRVMATRYSESMYLSDRILNCAAALESFDRIEFGSESREFAPPIRRCVSLAGGPFLDLVGDAEPWVIAFRDERNDVAHHLGRRSDDAAPGRIFLAESAFWLFVLCMMRKADAPENAYQRLALSSHMSWIREGIADVLRAKATEPK